MLYAGIDIGKQKHFVAIVDAAGEVVAKSRGFQEDAEGYDWLLERLSAHEVGLVAMEATGHYWMNLFSRLVSAGHTVALINPVRTHHHAAQELRRAKTDAVDAMGIARFAALHKPEATPLPDPVLTGLRELVRLRDRVVQDQGDRLRQLHRAMDLSFPELPRLMTLKSLQAWAILQRWPTAQAVAKAKESDLAKVVYDGRHRVGKKLAKELRRAAQSSVGAHQGPVFALEVRMFVEDLVRLDARIRELDALIAAHLDDHDVGGLLMTIPGIGQQSAAHILAATGDPRSFRSAKAFAAYAGLTPRINHSGQRTPLRAPICKTGNAELRKKLWMPTMTAVKKNPWLENFYERLISRGKPKKVALIASMRKLLTAVYSVAKSGEPFEPRLPAEA